MKIVYKVLAPIFGILSLVGMYFLPILRVSISSSLSEALMANIGLKEFYSVNFLVKTFTSKELSNQLLKMLFDAVKEPDSKIAAMFADVKGWLIAAVVLLCIAVVLTVVMIFFAVFSKRPLIGTCLTGGVIAFSVAANACFNTFAKPILSGEIGIGSLLKSASSDKTINTLSSLIGSAVGVNACQLSYAYSILMFLMVCLLIVGICACFEKGFAGNK